MTLCDRCAGVTIARICALVTCSECRLTADWWSETDPNVNEPVLPSDPLETWVAGMPEARIRARLHAMDQGGWVMIPPGLLDSDVATMRSALQAGVEHIENERIRAATVTAQQRHHTIFSDYGVLVGRMLPATRSSIMPFVVWAISVRTPKLDASSVIGVLGTISAWHKQASEVLM